ncbi:MAG: hypothetical protein QW641_02010 [Candidatus Aenigmatarchaeota archaeon]
MDLKREFGYDGGKVIRLLKEIADHLINEDIKNSKYEYIISDIMTRVKEHYQRLDNKYKKSFDLETLLMVLIGHVISHNGLKMDDNKKERAIEYILEKIFPKYGLDFRVRKWEKEPDEPNGILNNLLAQYKPNHK